MSLENQIHEWVLGLDGVGTVYSADPLWLTAAKVLGALVISGEPAGAVPFVVCVEDEVEGHSLMTVKVRIGADGSVPAPSLARSVAAEIRSFVAGQRPETDVKAVVEIAAIGI
ncbi:hypothetical protein [Arthrobacter sp. TWP1-1]|uniref:hypothetical protein n=1 Tax=Arthrobacter sp. TWP1-1 TaxID=2804568 RepID=UPI003CEB985B